MKNGKTVDDEGTIIYRRNGRYHRENGPALEYLDGLKIWYKNGYVHNENGPAVVYSSGLTEYYLNGSEITRQKFEEFRVKNFLDELLK